MTELEALNSIATSLIGLHKSFEGFSIIMVILIIATCAS